MRTYDSYKDSGIEWIGEIPRHWLVMKTNHLTNNLDGLRIPLNSEERSDIQGDIPYWGSNGIVDYVNKYTINEEIVLVGEDGSPFFDRFKDVSFYVNQPVWVNNHIHVLKTKDNISPRFLTHSFNCVDYKEYITGSTRDKLTQSDLKRITHCIPPLSEQEQIVYYLDEKTSLIDEMVDKKKRKIELLKEYRTSLINTVVTKGLNPDVPMKDSGIEWIGQIPRHWVVSKFKYVSQIVTGNTPSKTDGGDYYTDNGFLWIKPTYLLGDKYVYDSDEKLTELGKSQTRVIPKHSIMICCIGNTIGKYGINKEEVSTNQQINSVVPDHTMILPWFCLYFVDVFTRDLLNRSNYVTLPILTKSDLENINVILPSFEEQFQIIKFIDEKTSEIDKTIELENKKIELLKEYRQSLISNVVTGKFKVVSE